MRRYIIFGVILLTVTVMFLVFGANTYESQEHSQEELDEQVILKDEATQTKKRLEKSFQNKRIEALLKGKWISREANTKKLHAGPCQSQNTIYDEGGNLTRTIVFRTEYDENGEVLYNAVDKDGDGIEDLTISFTYDDFGNVVSLNRGGEKPVFERKIEYDEEGNNVRTFDKRRGNTDYRLYEERSFDEDG